MEEREFAAEVGVAQPVDAKGITYVQQETWLATYPNKEAGIDREDIEKLNFTGDDYLQRWQQSLETIKGDRQTWVARENGEVIGYCVARKGDEANRLQAIYVSPSHQGRDLGKKLMEAAFVWLGNEKDILLDVASYNASSIRFYESIGFRRTGKDSEYIVPGGSLKIPQTEMRFKQARR